MGLSDYFNETALKSNFSDLLLKYDKEQDGFSQKEFRTAIKDITSIFARGIVKISGYDKKLFKQLDADTNQTVSYEEMAKYIKKEYNLDFYSFKGMTLEEICNLISESK